VSIRELSLERHEQDSRAVGYNLDTMPWSKVAWALGCPVMEPHAFNLTLGERVTAMALCYVNRGPKGRGTARMVHLSYLGERTATWRAGVAAVEDALRARGCTMMSVLASHPAFVTALRDRGFVVARHTPLWLRDPAGVVPRQAWHLTAVESDLGHRNV
jgi:hypothetical protein